MMVPLARRVLRLYIVVLLLLTGQCWAQTNFLVPRGAVWSFLDDISNPDPSWTQLEFDDSEWSAGNAPLGYGEPGVIVTPTATGSQVNFFRHKFELMTVPAVPNLTLRVWRDDFARIYVNGQPVFEDSPSRTGEWTPPAVRTMDSSVLQPGTNIVAAQVRQASISSSDLVFDLEISYTNAPPSDPQIVITAPASNTMVRIGTNLTIEATVFALSNVVSVQFFEDGNLIGQDLDSPYSTVWNSVPEGTHFLTAVAVSPSASVTSAPVRIVAVTNIPSQVAITSPANNSVIDQGDVPIRATASDADGSITQVEFFEGTTSLGVATTAPYNITWLDVPEGDYALTAQAIDNDGLVVISEVVLIQVRVPPPATLLRGPYLQSANPNSLVVRWRTDSATSSRVRYGPNPNNLNLSIEAADSVTEHEIQLTGLHPDTKYYYSIGSLSAPLVSGPDFFFITAPASPKPTRVWAIGDSGTASADARSVFDAYAAFTGTRYTDVWLMLGDNAYGSGTDGQYQAAVFQMYPEILRQTVLWPTIGNHDADRAYFDIFSLPRDGRAGGVPSGSESYYSFNYGNIHFICLDSSFSLRSSNAPMCIWLREDLAANDKEWTIAYWHHPPYSKGSHDSDREHELIAMRENAVPILEEYGVDLVLCGHSHCYERSFFMRGHYGHSSTLDPSMMLDNGSGRTDDTGAYRKTLVGPSAHHGTVYVVAGSSGWATFGSLNHPIMYYDELIMGSLVLDIDGPVLTAKFLTLDGSTNDYFTIMKESSDFRFTALQLASGEVHLTWNSEPNKRYRIEFAPDLSSSFTTVSEEVPATGTSTTWIHRPAPGSPLGFYRAVELSD